MTAFATFDHQPRTRLVFGVGTVEQVGELAVEIGMKKVLLVTDPGVVAAGHMERVRQSLSRAWITASKWPGKRGSMESSVWAAAAAWIRRRVVISY
jgi:alcohol dehydrogenase class IV